MTIVWHEHHIIPEHMGGTNVPENMLRVNIAMHAFLHKCLYEEYGCWQDELAWKCLTGQIANSEINREKSRQVGRMVLSNPDHPFHHAKGEKHPLFGKKRPLHSEKMKKQEYRRRKYEITHPNGHTEVVVGLVEFCKQHNLNASNLCQVAKGNKTHAKGYKCKRILE